MTELLTLWAAWLPELWTGFVLSMQVTVASLGLGIVLGLVLALGVSAPSRLLRYPALAIVELGRGAPVLILLQYLYFGLPSVNLTLTSFWAAALAMAYCTAAYTSEIIRGGLEAVARGQAEAAEAIGLGRLDALRFVILPQALRVALPPLLGFSIMMFQASSLCFTIALPEIVSRASAIGSSTFEYMPVLTLAGLMYAAVCAPATLGVAALEERLAPGGRG
ncbi:amino acid ABC transporter permease [Metapseudomonas furukawaii]|uniref:Amino acid ABC transporter n=1 Tax=Metapseudomonas furukawaii TaxID=1149133 RepID=A0AAD1FHV3_METFU|nr:MULTISPECIES: amino acid ABC transporter permease [Pseudomonas]ELS29371.1 amino acid ABC transporter, permease protein [Pseudomonas furukawaii]OWJ92545.1 amino acid ABC transporter permease [Pseudomonas sp. A46]BAU75778.1 amino acid ABC transporter [Pseudomonas furukawaii]